MSYLPNRLCLAALLILASPLWAQSEPLGDVARHVRAERQQKGEHPQKVWTNEDFEATHESSPAPSANEQQAADGSSVEKKNSTKANASEAKDADKTAAGKESEQEKRSKELAKSYTDRIAKLHEDVAAAQKQLEQLQHERYVSGSEFRAGNSTMPNASEYEAQQHQFQQQIDGQKKKIGDLNQQLDDAREAARHAGVRNSDEL